MEELLKYLLAHNRELSEQVVQLSKLVSELATTITGVRGPHVLQGGNWNVQTLTADPLEPMYMPETEEDARWASDNGLITKDELEDVLAQLNFENSTIDDLGS